MDRIAGSAVLFTLVLACTACSEDSTVGGGDTSCRPGELQREDRTCQPAGLPFDLPCPPGTLAGATGDCQLAGIPPDGCGEGFVHDGGYGCLPILPDAPCPYGQMAIPGDAACRPIAPCGSGTWGDIPGDSGSEYVDQSYAGGTSDGSQDHPWTTIGEAFEAAASGAIIAVAEGSYVENVAIYDKPVRLWGRCPTLVEIVGTGAEFMTVSIWPGAAGSEVRSLTIRGPSGGLGVTGATAVLGDQLWIRHNGAAGVSTVDSNGPTELLLSNSLVEDNSQVAVILAGGQVTIESSVVTRTHVVPSAAFAYGITAKPQSEQKPVVILRRSVVSRSHEANLFLVGTDATIEASVVQDSEASSLDEHADGVVVLPDATTGLASTLVMRSSVIARNRYQGLYVGGSDAVVETTCVRDNTGGSPNQPGIGVEVQTALGIPANVTLRRSFVHNNRQVGVQTVSSALTVEGSVVSATQPADDGYAGWGVAGVAGPQTGMAANVAVVGSIVEANHHVGIGVVSSVTTVDTTIVRGTYATQEEKAGRGIQLQPGIDGAGPATLSLTSSVVEVADGQAVGVFGSSATIETSLLWQIGPDFLGSSGDGVIVARSMGLTPSLHTVGTHIADSPRAAIASFGGQIALGSSALTCSALDLNGEIHDGVHFEFDDLGNNACGCPSAADPCALVSSSLEPPAPVGGLE